MMQTQVAEHPLFKEATTASPGKFRIVMLVDPHEAFPQHEYDDPEDAKQFVDWNNKRNFESTVPDLSVIFAVYDDQGQRIESKDFAVETKVN